MSSVLIVGGGVSGLVTAHRLLAASPDLDVTVVEGAARAGGNIRSDHVDGFTFEWGPNGFLGTVPETFTLVSELGLDDRLVVADAAAKKRFVLAGGQLCALPSSPLGLLRTPIVSLRGRLRALSEPFRAAPSFDADDTSEETVAAFGSRRFGPEVVRNVLDPLVTGIFGGDVERLSVAAAFPRLAALEREHGSLVRGMFAKARERGRARRAQKGGDTGMDGELKRRERTLYSFRSGMGELVEALAKGLGDRLILDSPLESVTVTGESSLAGAEAPRFRVRAVSGREFSARALVLATPARQAGSLVAGVAPELAGDLEAIPYASIAVVCLGYRREDVGHPLEGFGFLAPRASGVRTLGTIWVSSVFPDHAPEGSVSLRSMIGGAHDPEAVGKTADELIDLVTSDAGPLLGLGGEPTVTRVYRHVLGIPQYNVGHLARLRRIDARCAEIPGLCLTGNAYRGVGVNDCVVDAERTAWRVLEALS